MVFCITELDIGGAEKAVVRIATGLKVLGWSVRVISLRDAGAMARPLREAGIEVEALQCGHFADVRCFWRLRAALRSRLPDVLVTFLHQANIYGRLAARSAGVPVVVSGIRVADRRAWVRLTDRMTRHCADHYVAVSRSVAKTHAELCHISAERMSSIPNGVDVVSDVRSDESSAGNQILFVGRLCEQKNPLLLVDAFAMLPARFRETSRVVFVGEGPLRGALQTHIRQQGLNDRVQLLGFRDDCQNLMLSSTVMVLPSRWEGLPNVVLEAMAAGLPVIATDVDGTSELIADGDTGWLLPASKADRLAAAMEECLTRPGERLRRAKRALQLVRQEYSWASVVDRYDELLRSLLFDSAQN